MTAQQYAEQWDVDARNMGISGQYQWMIRQLGEATCVLEIGCGSGRSTLQLARAHRRVVVLEVNEYLLDMAARLLTGEGVEVETLSKEELASAKIDDGAQVKFVHIDVFEANLLDLIPQRAFDAVVCWLIGATPDTICKQFGKSIAGMAREDTTKYREVVQKRCFDIGRAVLKEKGKVHLVDRYGMESWECKDGMRTLVAEHMNVFAYPGYVITKDTVFFNKIEDSTMKSKIQYVRSAQGGSTNMLALGSVKALLCG